MFELEIKGDFRTVIEKLLRLQKFDIEKRLVEIGEQGVENLGLNTPVDTGETANSWYYELEKTKSGYKITWYNSNVNQGANIAVLIQYGHGTPTGGYVPGIDYINPAVKPLFEKLRSEIKREVR